MARQPLSRAPFTEQLTESITLRPSDPVHSMKKNNHSNNDTSSGGCCSGVRHHGCGCGCKGCLCRLTHFKDESNSEAYPGEGGRRGMPRPDVSLPNRASRFGSSMSSVRTDDSLFLSNGSFDNSLSAPDAFNGHYTANAIINGTGDQFPFSEEEEDGHHAWQHFISPANGLDHTSFEEDSSGMVIPGLMDDSMIAARGSSIDINERSILNSEYASSFVQSSATTSQILTGAGAAFDHHFLVRPLRLTPECRHSINVPICARCMH